MLDDLEVITTVAEKRTQRRTEIKGHWECVWAGADAGPSDIW